MIQLLLPAFNQLTGKELSLIQLPNIFLWLVTLAVVTGLLAGLYPAVYLSSFKPIYAFKSGSRNPLATTFIREGLVVFQFTISVVLILGAIVIGQQMNFISNQDLGFDKNQKIILPFQTNEAIKNSNTLKDQLLMNTQIESAAKGGTYPGIESVTDMLFYAEGKAAQENVDIQMNYAEPDYIGTLGIELLRGRDFAGEFSNDQNSLILNEEAIRQLGYSVDNALEKKVYFDFQGTARQMKIVGIVKDYHFNSLQQKIRPLALSVHPIFRGSTSYLILDVESNTYSELINTVRNTWNTINPNSPFIYSFLDQDFQKNYEKEERTARLIQYFTFIAIVIASLGLLGLTTFTAEQRVKEIGVRKVLGASIAQIVQLLSRDFIKLVLISIVISVPVSYYIMNAWLQDFAYHINIEWWIFLLAGSIAVTIAMMTVCFQAIKAAMVNPVNSLKSE